MYHQGGQNICGISIGVLCLESYFPKPPGHIKNPSALPFTLLYETMKGITVPKLLQDPSPEMIMPLIEAAQRLEAEGVRAITGSCGFLALFQKEIAQAVSIPVFTSSLIQVPLAYHMGGGSAPVGVITASKASLTDRHFDAVGAANIPVVIQGLEGSCEFREVILENQRTAMDMAKIETEVLAATEALLAQNPEIGAIVLECTDLPPYAHMIQKQVQRPVYDIITLSKMVHEAVLQRPYQGFMPV